MAEEKKSEQFITKEQRAVADDMVSFINASPSPFHAVDACIAMLKKAGFKPLDETDTSTIWTELSPGSYYFTRNQSTVVAFVKPKKFKAGNGFTIIGAHTDSPCFRTKPISKKTKEGYLMVGVEKYGGGLWHTWFDRDLSVAGRVMVSTKDGAESRLVRLTDPILRISNLAIHLDRDIRTRGFKPDVEEHTVPVFATQAAAELNASRCADTASPLDGEHHPLLIRLLAEELQVEADAIMDFELCLYDTQPSRIGGAFNEFVYSARLDNLAGTYTTLRALIDSRDASMDSESNIRMVCSFDNEEVGSSSNRGAASNLMLTTMQRLHGAKLFEAAVQRSILISCDMAHAVHPNFSAKHEAQHKPAMQRGLVIKYNCNQRYATTMVSTYHLMQVAKQSGLPLQKFVVKNSMPCGSTIGPILASRCGIRTVDVGCPQLSMHSIREVCGVKDIATSTELFTLFFKQFVALDASLKVD